MIIKIYLVIILLISFITDVKYRKILNIVTIPSIIFALLYHLIIWGNAGVLLSGKGLFVGLGLLIIPYLLGGIGAGDVKLLSAIGALMGVNFVFYSFIYTALIGGCIALLLLVKQKGLLNLLRSLFYNVVFFRSNLGLISLKKENHSSITFPYGVAIVFGSFWTLIWGGF